jgi:hypothetical protein
VIFREKSPGVGYVEMGLDAVIVEKLYGPTCYAQVRVRAVMESEFFGYIVEREEGGSCEGNPARWVEVARIDGQKDTDYDCGKPECEDCAEWRNR